MIVDEYDESSKLLRMAQVQFELTTPSCHEHCDLCMCAICPVPEHGADWKEGYISTADVCGSGPIWLCPDCYRIHTHGE